MYWDSTGLPYPDQDDTKSYCTITVYQNRSKVAWTAAHSGGGWQARVQTRAGGVTPSGLRGQWQVPAQRGGLRSRCSGRGGGSPLALQWAGDALSGEGWQARANAGGGGGGHLAGPKGGVTSARVAWAASVALWWAGRGLRLGRGALLPGRRLCRHDDYRPLASGLPYG